MSDQPVNVRDFAPLARERLDERIWNYVESAAADERTLGWNEEAWQQIRLAPRVLVDVSHVDTSVTLLGAELPHPVLLAPTAAHVNYHPGSESATLAGAGAAGALAVMSTLGSTAVEGLGAAATGPWWFQMYVQPDRGFTGALLDRAAAAGAAAVVVTVDTPLLGARDRDRRIGGHTVDGLEPPNLAGLELRPDDPTAPAHLQVYNPHLDPTLTWDVLDWLVSVSPVPVLVKGVLRADDAARAVERGVSGVIVSNHGARNLDTVPATADALPGVVAAVDGRVPVLVDGGIRRGTDVLKALCLGAEAVLIGRPAIWGLAADGSQGVRTVLEMLRTELVMAMALCGAPSLADLSPDLLWG